MSRKANKTGRGGGERFVALKHVMLESLAWRSLSSDAKALLIDVWQRHNGTNNGYIGYAVREAEAIGIGRNRAMRAFNELVNHGFLKVAKQSSFTTKTKESRTWELTGEKVGDEKASMDFMRWSAAHGQSHQRDRDRGDKSKTRSHQRDARSHQRDRDPQTGNEITSDSPTSVTVIAKNALSRSHQRDTSIVPGTRNEKIASLPSLTASFQRPAALCRDEKPKLALGNVRVEPDDIIEADFRTADDAA
ncbi:hypothetical protein [Dongia sp.]|uniref:hypothetical protein n=1 Tax=Dongia sp. TaxID=1977262 RepID=UPI0035B3C9F1